MFFPERIKSIKENDKVLEIGPGATPFHRSDVFLEKAYDSEKELIAQSGHVGVLKTDKKIVYYKGDKFPFKDKEFDYIICSHVLEHVEGVNEFLSEIVRVGKAGYIEFPTIYYDYLNNIEEHLNMLFIYKNIIYWCKKSETPIPDLQPFTAFFRELQYKNYRFQKEINPLWHHGMEWSNNILNVKVDNWKELTYPIHELKDLVKPVKLYPNQPKQLGIKMALGQLFKAIKLKFIKGK